MRFFVLPAAVLLALCLYLPLPSAKDFISRALASFHAAVRRGFTSKKGKTDERAALAVYSLALAATATLLCALHPAVSAIVCAPLFSAFWLLPRCSQAKLDLDSGKYVRDRAAYEQQVIAVCEPLGDGFAKELILPLLLVFLGMPTSLGGALGWVYAGMRAAQPLVPGVSRVLSPLDPLGDKVMTALLQLCSGLVGHNPLRFGGKGASQRLMYILGLAHRREEEQHAPMAGDISQAAFLCCSCAGFLCLMLTLILFFIL